MMNLLLTLLTIVFTGFILSRILRRNDIADVIWGLGVIALAATQVYEVGTLSFRAMVIFALTVIWGLRLAIYIGSRNTKKLEDARYANWRRDWGKTEPLRAFLQVFVLQTILLAVVALPVLITIRMPATPLTPFDFLGLCLFLIGFLFETVADSEMSQFKKNKKPTEKILNTGVWAYCRHPNYFGEILIWWGLFFIALNVHMGWIAIASPILVTFLLTKVSGVPMLENLLKERGEAFKKYVTETPALLPIKTKTLLTFFKIVIVTAALDLFWLGFLMKDFYQSQLSEFMGPPIIWAAAGVYFFIPLGIQFFAKGSAFKGALFGLCTYAVYEFTNLALIKNWPIEMALVDIAWGTALCFLSTLATRKNYSN